MARTKRIVYLGELIPSREDGSRLFEVYKTTNTTDPAVGSLITLRGADDLIEVGITVHISKAKIRPFVP